MMIGSPSDLAEERRAATDAVNEWNVLHADAADAVLLPVKLETHATPTSGVRPQSASTISLSTVATSSSECSGPSSARLRASRHRERWEEIDRFVAAGKPAILYFSRRKITKDKIDPKQAAKLKKFKSTTYKKSLVGSFASSAELKRVLLRDLTRQIGMLQPGQPGHPGRIDRAREITELIKQHKQHGITIDEFKSYGRIARNEETQQSRNT